jgi:hypothetical protein
LKSGLRNTSHYPQQMDESLLKQSWSQFESRTCRPKKNCYGMFLATVNTNSWMPPWKSRQKIGFKGEPISVIGRVACFTRSNWQLAHLYLLFGQFCLRVSRSKIFAATDNWLCGSSLPAYYQEGLWQPHYSSLKPRTEFITN